MASHSRGMRHHLARDAADPSAFEAGQLSGSDDDLEAERIAEAQFRPPVDEQRQAFQHMQVDKALAPEQRLEVQISHAVHAIRGDTLAIGETIVQVGGEAGMVPGHLTQAQVELVIARITAAAAEMPADVTRLHEMTTKDAVLDPGADAPPAPAPAAPAAPAASAANGAAAAAPAAPAGPAAAPAGAAAAAAGGAGGVEYGRIAFLLVRKRALGSEQLEVRVAVIGNVDSGKSTMVGVLTRAMLDDGRGAARAKVFKHHHEGETGRTSSIGQHNLCLGSGGNILNDGMFKPSTCSDYVAKSSKIVTLVDLAGHEKYFKTTAYGLTGHLPDYACLLVGANAGVVGMCKEHLGVALALKVPVFFVVTKVDICPDHILKNSLSALTAILKKPGVRKRPFLVKNVEDVITCAQAATSEALAPIFLTSAVTGKGMPLLRLFVNLLPQRLQWCVRQREPAEFIIDEVFSVPGVGTVVAGTVKRGVLTGGTPLVLGPDIGDGSFKGAAIKSIHYKRLPVSRVVAGQTAAIALKKVKRDQVRKGMVLVHRSVEPVASWEFDAEIAVLTHSTTIQPRYQAVIHCEIIRQAARVVAMDREHLRSGDRATVRFRFMQHPEYLTVGTRFVFREGRTKGIGMVASTAVDCVP